MSSSATQLLKETEMQMPIVDSSDGLTGSTISNPAITLNDASPESAPPSIDENSVRPTNSRTIPALHITTTLDTQPVPYCTTSSPTRETMDVDTSLSHKRGVYKALRIPEDLRVLPPLSEAQDAPITPIDQIGTKPTTPTAPKQLPHRTASATITMSSNIKEVKRLRRPRLARCSSSKLSRLHPGLKHSKGQFPPISPITQAYEKVGPLASPITLVPGFAGSSTMDPFPTPVSESFADSGVLGH